jgi:hypothetical protein
MVALSSSLQNVEALHDPALASWEFYPLLSFRARSEFCSRRGPHSMTAILLLAAVTVAPVAPLLLTMMPLEELLKKLLGILF